MHTETKMARSDEAQAFFYAVYQAVQEIPLGKVTSYGHIAMLVGTRTSAVYCQHVPPAYHLHSVFLYHKDRELILRDVLT